MGFSKKQQGFYRPMVTRAWQKHCSCHGQDAGNRAAKDAWYRAELVKCIGRDTTKDCEPCRDYETVMAHFEAICGGELYWNLRVFSGDTCRLQYSIRKICEEYNIDDSYARAVAVKVLKWPSRLNSLAEITNAADLQKVRIALILQARREAKKADERDDSSPQKPEMKSSLQPRIYHLKRTPRV